MQQSIVKLLRWSERYTKTDMVYLAKGGSALSFGYVVSMIVGLLFAIGLANFLPKDVYGQYSFVLSLAGIIGAFTITGLGTATTRAVAQGYEGTLHKSFLSYMRWGALTFLISSAGALYYYINENYTLALSLLIVGSLSPIAASSSLYNAYLTGKKKFTTKAIYNVIQNILPPIAILSVAYVSENVVYIILTYFLSTALIGGLLYVRTLQAFKPNKETNDETIGYAKHLSLMDILGSISLHIDKVLVFHYLGAVQLAIYTFAITVPRRLQSFNKILKTLVFPKIAEQSLESIRKNIAQKAFLLFLGAIGITAAYIFAAPYIFTYLFPQYTDSIIYSQFFALTLLFFPSMLYNQTLLAHMRKKELYIIKISAPILRIVLLLILLPLYGIWGAISAILLTRLIEFILQLVLFYRMS